jgi:hypothetical protein
MNKYLDVSITVPPGGFSPAWSTRNKMFASQFYLRAVDLGYAENVAWQLALMATEKMIRNSHIEYTPTWERRLLRFMDEITAASTAVTTVTVEAS